MILKCKNFIGVGLGDIVILHRVYMLLTMIINFVRTIKINKLNGEFDNLSEDENFFVSLFDGLVQTKKELFIQLRDKNNKIYFEYGLTSNMFWYSKYMVLDPIVNKFGYSQKNTEFLITRFLQYRLKMDRVIIIESFSY